MQKNVSELMKNSIKRKYGSNGSYMAVMATMAAMAKTMMTIKNFVINRRVFLNQVPQKTSMLATSFCMPPQNS